MWQGAVNGMFLCLQHAHSEVQSAAPNSAVEVVLLGGRMKANADDT